MYKDVTFCPLLIIAADLQILKKFPWILFAVVMHSDTGTPYHANITDNMMNYTWHMHTHMHARTHAYIHTHMHTVLYLAAEICQMLTDLMIDNPKLAEGLKQAKEQ